MILSRKIIILVLLIKIIIIKIIIYINQIDKLMKLSMIKNIKLHMILGEEIIQEIKLQQEQILPIIKLKKINTIYQI